MIPELTDLVGQVISEGDYVAYTTRTGSGHYMHVMRVDAIEHKTDRYDRDVWTLHGEVVRSSQSWRKLPSAVRVSVRSNGWVRIDPSAFEEAA